MASTAKRLSKFSRKKLLGLVKDDMGYTDDDFDFGSIRKPELIEIALKHMGPDSIPSNYSKGGTATKKAIGPQDYRKGGMTLSTVDNRKNK